MKLYKFTNADSITKNNTKWSVGITVSIDKKLRKPKLCSNGVLHAYKDLNLALLIYPIHNVSPHKIFIVDGDIKIETWDKIGSYELAVKKEIQTPKWYNDKLMRIEIQKEFALLCAESVIDIYSNYIEDNINAITNCINAIKLYKTNIITKNELYAAIDAADDAIDIASADDAIDAVEAATATTDAAGAATATTYIAADTANAAASANAAITATAKQNINFIKLAKQAIQNIKIDKKEII